MRTRQKSLLGAGFLRTLLHRNKKEEKKYNWFDLQPSWTCRHQDMIISAKIWSTIIGIFVALCYGKQIILIVGGLLSGLP